MPITEPDDNIEDLESSTESTLDAATESSDASAESSDATGETGDDVLSIVRDVVGAEKKVDPVASPAEGLEGGREADGAATHEPDDVDYTDVPFNKHPRFQHLLRKAKANEQDATRYRNVQNCLDHNGLVAEEAADALLVAGLLKTNPAEAWNRLKPIVQSLLAAVGEVLPDDLTRRVQAGELSQDAALEVSRARALTESQQRSFSFEQRRAQQAREQEQVSSLVRTAEGWEADRRIKDPHFEAKLPLLQDTLAGIHQREGRANTPEGVREQLKRAYDVTNSRFVPPAPAAAVRKPAVRPVSSAQVAGTAQAKPQSTLDIIRSVRAQR